MHMFLQIKKENLKHQVQFSNLKLTALKHFKESCSPYIKAIESGSKRETR